MIIDEGGIPFIKHYLLDFGSTFGSATNGPNSSRSGFEELFSWKSSAREFFTLGLYVPYWAKAIATIVRLESGFAASIRLRLRC